MKRLLLPGCLNFFQNSDGKCEHNIKAAKPLLLIWHDKLTAGNLLKDAFNSTNGFLSNPDLVKIDSADSAQTFKTQSTNMLKIPHIFLQYLC